MPVMATFYKLSCTGIGIDTDGLSCFAFRGIAVNDIALSVDADARWVAGFFKRLVHGIGHMLALFPGQPLEGFAEFFHVAIDQSFIGVAQGISFLARCNHS